jgi:hypothetical protein
MIVQEREFKITVLRYLQPEKLQLCLTCNAPDVHFDAREFITDTVLERLRGAGATLADHFHIQVKRNTFRLINPAIKHESARKIQRLVRRVLGRVHARRQRKQLRLARQNSALRIQIYWKYARWQAEFHAQRYITIKL